ncbi:MAG: ABC transporter substrate-binding protein [Alphaproteobacteria bacterium]|nr:ABC transporter substrate-binding protein [Alphaproteobacteria bacterium]
MSTTRLTVMVFPGTQTLPLFAAQANGYFAKRGLDVQLVPAPNSEEQRRGLAEGRFEIVHGAADQCVALAAAGTDAAIVAGGDNGFNRLFVQPDIARIEDLRGRTLVADVANTGWSFVLYDILRRHGLRRGDYRIHEAGAPVRRFEAMRDSKDMAAAILNPPYAIHARRAGLKDMGAVADTVGAYLGTVPYVLRSWAREKPDVLVSYLAATIAGLRWALDPSNASEATALYAERLNLPPDIAREMYSVASDSKHGLARDAAFDREGFDTVLRLRATAEGREPMAAEPLADLTHRRRALALLEQ